MQSAIPPLRPDQGPRFLLYSHDSVGLGHVRRNLELARALCSQIEGSSALLVTGSPCATQFAVPEGVDLVKLPAITKDKRGEYVTRSLRMERERVVALRRELLLASFRVFDPDLVLIDHQITGLLDEASLLLGEARERGVRTALGLRDIVDEPGRVARDLDRKGVRETLLAYDHVFVYGDERVFDPRVEYNLPEEVNERLEFTGYVVRQTPRWSVRPVPRLQPQVLLTVGGGQDGADRVELWLEALESGPVDWESTIVLGPLYDERRARSVKRRARALDGVRVHRFHAELPRLFADADLVVSMAGYNTAAEILESGVPSVLLPRTWPRREQELRAERLQSLGHARSMKRPTPSSLREVVSDSLRSPAKPNCDLSLRGAHRLAQRVADHLQATSLLANAHGAIS